MVPVERDLGVWVSDDLKFREHVNRAVARANQMLSQIKRAITFRNGQVVKLLYVSLVRPHLEYTNVVWHPKYRYEIEQIKAVQRRVLKIIPELKNMTYQERL